MGRDFLEVKSKGYIRQGNVGEKCKGMSGNSNLFNSRKPSIIKRDLSKLKGLSRQLKLQSKKDHDLHSSQKWTTS